MGRLLKLHPYWATVTGQLLEAGLIPRVLVPGQLRQVPTSTVLHPGVVEDSCRQASGQAAGKNQGGGGGEARQLEPELRGRRKDAGPGEGKTPKSWETNNHWPSSCRSRGCLLVYLPSSWIQCPSVEFSTLIEIGLPLYGMVWYGNPHPTSSDQIWLVST